MTEDSRDWGFVETRDKYFGKNLPPVIMVQLDESTNIFSRENQLKQYEFE